MNGYNVGMMIVTIFTAVLYVVAVRRSRFDRQYMLASRVSRLHDSLNALKLEGQFKSQPRLFNEIKRRIDCLEQATYCNIWDIVSVSQKIKVDENTEKLFRDYEKDLNAMPPRVKELHHEMALAFYYITTENTFGIRHITFVSSQILIIVRHISPIFEKDSRVIAALDQGKLPIRSTQWGNLPHCPVR